MQSSKRINRIGRLIALCGTLALAAGCTVSNQEAPPLAGPSGFGMVVRMTATPEVLPRDGASVSVINIDARDGDQPFANGRLLLSASAGSLSAAEAVTDKNGHATFLFTAPSLNDNVSQATIFVTPIKNGDVADARSDSIRVAVVGPSVPFATFNFTPTSPQGAEAVTFDASFSTLDGQPCPLCTYSWNFGDGNSGNGQVIQHTYSSFGVQNVTLTVTSPQGPASSLTRAVVIALPSAPIAEFTVTPTSPLANTNATFDGNTSTVGAGATIQQWLWDFGDGTPTGSGNRVTHSFAAIGPYTVKLTVTDSLGRQASKTTTVTVQ